MATVQVELPANNYITAIVSREIYRKRPLFSQRITTASLIERDLVGVRLVPTPTAVNHRARIVVEDNANAR